MSKAVKQYDLVIVGGGGGLKLVGPALKKKLKVAVIEKDFLGGTCLNRGCIPSKMLIHPADVAKEIREASKFGINVNKKFTVNFAQLTSRITETVSEDSQNIAKRYKKIEGLDYYAGTAKFIDKKVLQVGRTQIMGKKILLAVGARPRVPPIPGLVDVPYMTSTEALRNKKLPKKLIVIGGGYIAVELGHAYAALGSKVHFLVRGKMVGREDLEVIEEFENVFRKDHNVIDITSIEQVEHKKGTFSLKYTSSEGKKKTISGDGLLVATGVMPNNDLLHLEKTGLNANKFGFLDVNKEMETPVKGIYAIGDCVGNYLFRHSVNFEAEYLVDQWFERKVKKAPIKYPPMPHAIFTNPQIAGVGMTEEELKAKKIPYVVGKNKYINSAMGMAYLSEYGFVKLLFHKKTKKLVGAHIIGPEASTMIHQLIAQMTAGGTIDTVLKMIYIHPALPEIVRNAARNAQKEF
jgi:dihydrolipoamide dehydrogenase